MGIEDLKPTIKEILKTLQLFRPEDTRREQLWNLILKDPSLYSEVIQKFVNK